MAARNALSSLGCWNCRASVLRIFAGPHLRAQSHLAIWTSRPQFKANPTLPHTTARLFSSLPESNQSPEDVETNSSQTTSTPDSADPDTPWYLQVDPPRHVATMEPPPLPKIPLDSPKVLAPLLEYVSEDMGLEDISLLDLRTVEPQPALGPNLFMLFGTARSERHLNVSAGRLVRWLRVKHHIEADADGLLGPNEKKRKLKRKAKKAKLLGTMGNDDADDGISTGWICVHLGSIGRDASESAVQGEDGRVAGFGVVQQGSTIVVQVMTESRREELGLEKLWLDALEGPKPASKVDMEEADVPKKAPASKAKSNANMHPLDQAIRAAAHPTRPTLGGKASGTKNQASFYSTYTKGEDPLIPKSFEKLAQTLTFDASQKWRVLDLLVARLNQMNPAETRETFSGVEDAQRPSPFLQLFELAITNLPPEQTWKYRLALQTKACESQFSASISSLADVQNLIAELRISAIPATREQYMALLSCIYRVSGAEIEEQSTMALEVFQTMQLRGQEILANDAIAAIIEAKLSTSSRAACEEFISRLQQLRVQLNLPCMEERLLSRLLTVFTQANWWEEVWDIWGMPARYLLPRSPAMYDHIYQLGAAQGKEAATRILRHCFESMFKEQPPVMPIGQVRHSLKACISAADPEALQTAASLQHAPVHELHGQQKLLADREFVKIARQLGG